MKLRVLILLGIATLAACHREPGAVPVAPVRPRAGVSAAAPRGPNAQELTEGMVEAVTQGRSQTPVLLKFDLLRRPVEGQPLEVAIAVIPQIAARLAKVEVTGGDGLRLEAADQQFEFPTVEAAQVYRHSIKVMPTAGGLYFLTFAVSLQQDQSSDSRVFSVPILVGTSPAAPTAAQQKDPAARPGS
jgi:hypothetical protein